MLRPQVPLLLAGVLLLGQTALTCLWPGVWTLASHPGLIAVNIVLGLLFISTVPAPRLRARRISLGLALLSAQALGLLYMAVAYPARFHFFPGGLLAALAVWIGLATSLSSARDGADGTWLTGPLLWHCALPTATLVAAGLAYVGRGVPRDWGPPLLMASAALLIYVVGQFTLVQQAVHHRGEDNDYPKGYYESLRLIVNVLVVANGVLMGLIKDGTFAYRTLVLGVLAAGIAVGVFHLAVLVGAIHEEFTLKRTADGEVTSSYVKLHPVHNRFSQILLNLQFYSILVGTALIAAEWV